MAAPSKGSAARLFGRERELRHLSESLSQVIRDNVPSLVRVLGHAGYGKTSLLGVFAERARTEDWVVFETRCHPSQQRTAVAALRRLVENGLRTLPCDKEPYVSGLEPDLQVSEVNVARYERAVVRLFDALLLDHPILMIVDDAQWLDVESASALQHILESVTSARLLIVLGQRAGRAAPVGDEIVTTTIVLEPLAADAARATVEYVYPGATAEVIGALVERSAGIPFDLVALAERARDDRAASVSDVLDSVRKTIAVQVEALSPALREFLQICSLIQEPIELTLLSELLPADVDAFELISAAMPRFMSTEDSELRFTHDLVGSAVRSTIAVSVPLHRRILNGLLAVPAPTLSDLNRIAYHAHACGDAELEFAYLVKLARKSFALQAYDLSIRAFERAIELRSPPDDLYVDFFKEYGSALRLSDRWLEARKVLEDAVQRAVDRRLAGWGALAVALVWCVALLEDAETAKSSYERLLVSAANPEDRAALLSAGAALAMLLKDRSALSAIRGEIEDAARTAPSQSAAATVLIMDARLDAQLGDYEGARAAIQATAAITDHSLTGHDFTALVLSLQIDLLERGCVAVGDRIGELLRRASQDMPRSVLLNLLELATYCDFARGFWDDALSKTNASNPTDIRLGNYRARSVCVAAGIAALTGVESQHEAVIADALSEALRLRKRNQALQLGFWRAAFLVAKDRAQAVEIAERLKPWLQETIYSTTFFAPLSAALYAWRAKDAALLRTLCESASRRSNNWEDAQWMLSAGIAQHALGNSTAPMLLRKAADALRPLGADLFAALAASLGQNERESDRTLLAALRVGREFTMHHQGAATSAQKTHRSPVGSATMREVQVAELIAEGRSNRQIAEELVLSERTVETHVANLFSKLGASSRVEVARWVLERRQVVA
jgi:DNA-binding CsgD family transcriptional regulator